MRDELVDRDGFPRQDIDVYQVRHARHKIICLQNDHKAIMKEIEEGLHQIHMQTSETAMECSKAEEQAEKEINYKPIAKVNFVDDDSPAFTAVSTNNLNSHKVVTSLSPKPLELIGFADFSQ